MDGPITRYDNIKECLKKVPLDKIVIETDAPLLPPLPYSKSQRCDSTMLNIILKEMSYILNIGQKELLKLTNENSKTIFDFSK
ncbi:MAG: TatD family hydrolase [Clostridia bacterium]